MTRASLRAARIARVALELLLATLALWLVVQNALLLAASPWKATPAALVVVEALGKVGFAVLRTIGPWAALAAIAAGLGMAWVLRDGRDRPAREV